jgi:hypothetical protein
MSDVFTVSFGQRREMRVELEITSSDPPSGWVRAANHPPERFDGRVGLLAAIDRICAPAGAGEGILRRRESGSADAGVHRTTHP